MTILSEFSDAAQALAAKTARRVVAINAGSRNAASGIVWRPGLIVTASEALGGDESVEVTLPDGRAATASLAGRDPSTDIALLRIEDGYKGPESFNSARAVRAGHFSVAVGRTGNGELVSSGIVKEVGGSWTSWAGGMIDRQILLDISLDRRAHGGAVVDATGDLVGLAAFAPRHQALVIPTETIERVAERLARTGGISRGYLGVGLHPLRTGGGGSGTIIVQVDEDGPARRAGLFVGDIVTGWNNEPVKGVRDVMMRLGPDAVGSTVTLAVVRANQPTMVEVVIGERPHK